MMATYALPIIQRCFTPDVYRKLLEYSGDGWGPAYLRTSLFASASVIVQVLCGFVGAVFLRRVSRPVGHLFACLLVPVLLGSVALAFIVKLNLFKLPFVTGLIKERDPLYTWTFMILVQSWQFLTLSFYLFWMHLQTVPNATVDFAIASRLTPAECVRDVYWPHCYNLAIIITIFGSVQSLQEVSKVQLILRASSGTGTELAGHRLSRYYHTLAPADPVNAVDQTLSYSVIFIAIGLLTTAFGVFLVSKGGGILSRLYASFAALPRLSKRYLNATGIAIVLISMMPFLILTEYGFRAEFVDSRVFLNSILMSLLGLLVLIPVAILFAITCRLIWIRSLERFSSRSMFFFVGVYLLLFIPPIGLAFCGYRWLAILGSGLQSPIFVLGIWLMSQSILAFPVLATFVLYNNFRVRTSEIHLQRSARATIGETISYSFLARFRTENLLLAILGFSIIWNESSLSFVMSGLTRNLPSFSVELSNRVEGRLNAYYEASNLILAALIPIAVGLAVWTIVMCRRQRSGVRRAA